MTAEQVQAAVQAALDALGTNLTAVVTEASNGISGPTYNVSFTVTEIPTT